MDGAVAAVRAQVLQDGAAPRARRVPAGDVERLAQERLTVLKSQSEIFDAVELLFDAVNRRQQAADLAGRWPDLEPAAKRRIFECLVNRIDLTQETLEIRIAAGRLLEILWEEDNPKTFEPALWDNALTGDAPVNLASTCESASEVVSLDGAAHSFTVLALAFAMTGASKPTGNEMMVEAFANWGYAGWFMYVVGAVEIASVVAVLIPRIAALGGLWLGALMAGALGTHFVNAEYVEWIPAGVLLGPPLTLAFLRLGQHPASAGNKSQWRRRRGRGLDDKLGPSGAAYFPRKSRVRSNAKPV